MSTQRRKAKGGGGFAVPEARGDRVGPGAAEAAGDVLLAGEEDEDFDREPAHARPEPRDLGERGDVPVEAHARGAVRRGSRRAPGPARHSAAPPGRSASGAAPARPGLRIQKAMAQAGIASRREAERIVAEGTVRVNGKAVLQPGYMLQPGDRLDVAGRPVVWENRAPAELWALYKPKRCVCTLSDPQGRRTVKDFFPRTEQRLFPVGRLDYDAEGLLLLTSDGGLAQRVAHPSFQMPRVYLVKVKGAVEKETLRTLAQGIELDGRLRPPARTRVLHAVNDKTWLEVVLKEGIHHHLKRMFEAVGLPVLKIKRYQVGPVELGDLKPGQSRKLGRADVERLLHWSGTGRQHGAQAAQQHGAQAPQRDGAHAGRHDGVDPREAAGAGAPPAAPADDEAGLPRLKLGPAELVGQ